MAKKKVSILHREVELSNLDKVLYPSEGYTKAEVLNYYRRAAPWILPHLRLRPLTLKRYPNGVTEEHFYEKRCPEHRPPWMTTVPVKHRRGKTIDYCTVLDLATLIWVVNLGALELHVLLSRAPAVERPTAVVFDLDPGPPAGLLDAARIALLLRRVLEDLGLAAFAKVSGGKGVHCYVPLNVPYDFEQTKNFAQTVAKRIAAHYPDTVTEKMKKDLRGGKVFIDWSQNSEHKSTVCPYSLRAQDTPTVSAAVSWDELEAAVQSGSAEALRFTPDQTIARLKEQGDLMAPVLGVRQQLPGTAPQPVAAQPVWTRQSGGNGKHAGLAEYRRKRDFARTAEPAGAGDGGSAGGQFVIQKHAARSLHYDLRLECGGVLKSWALPKGPSLDPDEKRLAVEVEDHPLDYADFEGEIPEKEYGGGQVIVWDRGSYTLTGAKQFDESKVENAYSKGHIPLSLQGVKLQGDYDLVRTAKSDQGKTQWLLMKKADDACHVKPDPLNSEPYSVLSGLWVEDLRGASRK